MPFEMNFEKPSAFLFELTLNMILKKSDLEFFKMHLNQMHVQQILRHFIRILTSFYLKAKNSGHVIGIFLNLIWW